MRDPLVSALDLLCQKHGRHTVAREIEANEQTLYQIIKGVKLPSGRPKGVGAEMRSKLDARYPDWRGLADKQDNTIPGPRIRGSVPLLSSVQAGKFKEYVNNLSAGDAGMEQIPTSVPIKAHTFALRVAGDSMEPEFYDGMVLIVEPEMDAQPGDYVIAQNGGDETTFKQLIKDGGDWYLKPLNPRYPIKPLGDSRVIGVVRAVERRFR